MPSQMFLRTALTENRIETLEKQVEWIIKYLKVPSEPAQTDAEWEAAAPSERSSVAERLGDIEEDTGSTPVARTKAKGKARG